MTDAGGNNTMQRIGVEGEYTLWEIRNDSWDTGETLPVLTAAPISQITTVIPTGAVNRSTGQTLGGGVLTVLYDNNNRHFSATESGVSGSDLTIWFYAVN